MVLDFLQIVILVRKSTTLKKLPMQKDLRLISGICHMSRFPQCIGSLAPPSARFNFCMGQVLVMEYVPGIKINRIAALDELGVDRNRCYDCTLNIHAC